MLVLQCVFYRIWGHSGAIKGFCLVWTLHTHLRETRLLSPASLFLITSTEMHCNWSIMSQEFSSACPRRAELLKSHHLRQRGGLLWVTSWHKRRARPPVWISLLTRPSVRYLIPSHQGRWTTCPTQPQDETVPTHCKFYGINKSLFFSLQFFQVIFVKVCSRTEWTCLQKLLHMIFRVR